MKNNFFIPVLFFLFCSQIFSQSGWFPQQSGTNVLLNSVYFLNPYTGWICGESGKILKTMNGGDNWLQQTSNTTLSLNSVFFLNDNVGWCCGGLFDPNFISRMTVLKTSDGGNNWSIVFDQPSFTSYFVSVYFTDAMNGCVVEQGSTGFVGVGGIWITSNGGLNWTPVPGSGTAISNIQFTDSNTGWVLGKFWDDFQTDTAYILKSTNGGQSWIKKYQKPRMSLLSSHFLNNNTGWAGGGESSPSQNILLKTTDGGNNWERIILNSNNYPMTIFFVNTNLGWSCGDAVFNTTDGGYSWLLQSELGQNTYYRSMYFANSLNGWVVGSNGSIYKTNSGGIMSAASSTGSIANKFSLSQNYPNPFNPETVIRYSLSENRFVTLKIFDVLGNEVATLVNEKQNPGTYNYQLSTVNYQLSSGIYYYKLEAGDFSEVKKMILLK